MKKLLVCLLVAWFFLGQLSLKDFEAIDQQAFLIRVADAFNEQCKYGCEVVALIDEENVFVFGKCQERRVDL